MSLWHQLSEIYADVSQRFTYQSDLLTFGRVEHWAEPEFLDGTIIGDCEDFTLACRKMCRAQGIPTRLVFCQIDTGEYHIVLESGGWILDNRQNRVVNRDALDYQWLSISGYEAGDAWHKIQ